VTVFVLKGSGSPCLPSGVVLVVRVFGVLFLSCVCVSVSGVLFSVGMCVCVTC